MTNNSPCDTAGATQTEPGCLARALASLTDQFVLFDHKWRYTYVNEAAAQVLGLPPEKLLGQRIWDLFPDTVGTHFEQELRRAQHDQVDLVFENHDPRRDRWFENRVSISPDGVALLGIDITARKRAEQRRQQSERRLRLALKATHMVAWEWDPSADHVITTEQLAEIYGLPAIQRAEQRLVLVHPEDRVRYQAEVDQVATQGGSYHAQFRITRPDTGRTAWLEEWAYAELDPTGQVQRVVGVVMDITQRKANEAALQASEERLRLAVEATGLGIWEIYPDRGEINWSAQGKAMHGLPAETVISRDLVRTTIYPADLAALQSVMSAFYAPPRDRELNTEHRIVRSDGAVRWIRVQGRFADQDGQPPQRALGVMLDLTEQKQQEEELAASRRFLARIAQAIPDSLMVYDLPSQRIVFHNPMLIKVLGLSDEQSLAQTQLEMDGRVHPDDLAHVQQEFARLYTAADDDVIESTFRYRFPNGEYCWLQERTVVFARDATGAVTQHLSVSRDITERKAAEQDLHFLAELAERIRLADDADVLIQEVAQRVGEYLQVERCLFIEVDETADRGVVRGQHCRGVPPLASEYQISDYDPATWRGLTAGRPLINHDTEQDPGLAASYQAVYGPLPIRAYLIVPLLRIGQWLGALAVTSDHPRRWQLHEIKLLETVAERTWLAVEKLQLAAELRASEEELRVITDAVPGLIAYVDAAERYQFVNATYARWFGRERDQIVGKQVAELVAEAYGRVKPHIDTVLAGQAVTFENDLHYPSGHKTVLATYMPRLNEEGEVLGFYALITDITERKAAEERMRFMSEVTAVLTSSLDYSATLQRVAALMTPRLADWCSVDLLQPDGSIELVAVAHVDPTKVAWGREIRRRFPPDQKATQGLANVLRTGRAEFYPDIPFEQLLQSAQDEEQRAILALIPVKSLIIAPLRTRDQVIGAIQFVWSDSDRRYTEADLRFAEEFAQRAALAVDNARLYQEARTAEAQLREFNALLEQRVRARTAELERSNRELDQFAYIASHDLKSPLRGIEHLATFLLQDVGSTLPEPSQRHLTMIQGRIKRMEALLNDLLIYSRAGRLRYSPEGLDLAVLIEETVELLAPPAGFVVELGEPLPPLIGERVPLELIFRNLIGNAIKHHHDPAAGLVRITLVDQGEAIKVTVVDNGPGIDPAFHERIFEIFQTLKPRDEVEGSGIGLTVVKKLIETRGGAIWLESTPGRGTSFHFTWPKQPTVS